jgi:hypothetical protein
VPTKWVQLKKGGWSHDALTGARQRAEAERELLDAQLPCHQKLYRLVFVRSHESYFRKGLRYLWMVVSYLFRCILDLIKCTLRLLCCSCCCRVGSKYSTAHPDSGIEEDGEAKSEFVVGEVRLSIEILPAELATKKMAGPGRSEPNQHPHLADPLSSRLQLSVKSLKNPYKVMKQVMGDSFTNKLMVGSFYVMTVRARCSSIRQTLLYSLIEYRLYRVDKWPYRSHRVCHRSAPAGC